MNWIDTVAIVVIIKINTAMKSGIFGQNRIVCTGKRKGKCEPTATLAEVSSGNRLEASG